MAPLPKKDKSAGAESPRATIRDVARLAGVGSMTVSRVLNHHPYVTAATAARVRKAITKLDYSPNLTARVLRGSKAKTIGLIVPFLTDPFYAHIAQSIRTAASLRGYSVLIATSDEDHEKELAEVEIMMRRNIDGLMVAPAAGGKSRLTGYPFREVPVVTLDRLLKGRRFHSVAVQNQAGSALGVRHLIEQHHHRHIAFISLKGGMYTLGNRYDGYQKAMRTAGLTAGPQYECCSEEIMLHLLKDLLQGAERPTAIFAAHGRAIRQLLHVLARLQVSVPRDVALLGFDDSGLFDLLQPPVSVVRQPVSELGQAAAELLFSLLAVDAQARLTPTTTILPVELVLRRSCGC